MREIIAGREDGDGVARDDDGPDPVEMIVALELEGAPLVRTEDRPRIVLSRETFGLEFEVHCEGQGRVIHHRKMREGGPAFREKRSLFIATAMAKKRRMIMRISRRRRI